MNDDLLRSLTDDELALLEKSMKTLAGDLDALVELLKEMSVQTSLPLVLRSRKLAAELIARVTSKAKS